MDCNSAKEVKNFKQMAKYDPIAKKYMNSRQMNKFSENTFIEIPTMMKLVGKIKNKKILDLGCGFGDHAKRYSKKGASKVVGIDSCKEFIEFATNQNIKNSEFIIHDLNKNFYLGEKFDKITSSLTIDYIKDFNKLLKNINNHLKIGGEFIFSIGNPISFFSIEKEVTKDKIKKIFGYELSDNLKIYGNYFDEKPRIVDFHGNKIKKYPRTYQTIIQTILKNDFKIIDYMDPKPLKSSKKLDKNLFEINSKIPSFCFFKLKNN